MIINKVSELRKEKNITQGQLANELGVSRQTIISLEDNKSNISLYFAMKISKFFNKPIEQIFIQKDMINYFNNKATTVEGIRQLYGKNTIIIKGTIVFRCSTEVLEEGPECLLNFELPKYGKMKKFVVINDKVYELIATRDYNNRNDIVKHTIGEMVDINPNCINFNAKAWNHKDRKSQ